MSFIGRDAYKLKIYNTLHVAEGVEVKFSFPPNLHDICMPFILTNTCKDGVDKWSIF